MGAHVSAAAIAAGFARSLLLLLLLLRRWRLGAVCSERRGSRSPRNAHTLNRYIVDIRR